MLEYKMKIQVEEHNEKDIAAFLNKNRTLNDTHSSTPEGGEEKCWVEIKGSIEFLTSFIRRYFHQCGESLTTTIEII